MRRLLHILSALVLALLLGACAAPGPVSSGAAASGSSADTRATRHAPPVIPGGPLRSLDVDPPASLGKVAKLAPPGDLWDRIRRGFAMPTLDDERVEDRARWYTQRPEHLQRMAERSSKYLFHIVEELERRNLPSELALLPFVESAFNPQAVSTARAAGMWQFIPSTGKLYDLKQNAFRDDRRDVLASTRAALDFLESLHGQFGDWSLALAAYNWGPGNVKRAIERNRMAGLGTGYLDLKMPDETRMYVPKLLGLKQIVNRPQAYGATLPDIGNHPFFDTVTIERDIDVALIARLAEVSEADFRQLNPSMKKPLVLAAGQPTVLLPWDNAAIFQRQLALHQGPLASWTVWVVPERMSVAQAAKRTGMSSEALRRVNQVPPRMQFKQGSTLLVPRREDQTANVPEHVADNGQVLLAPEVSARRSTVRARSGETVTTLAKRLGLKPQDLAQWNRLSASAHLKKGQRLTVYLPPKKTASSASKRRTDTQVASTRTGGQGGAATAGKRKP